MRGERWALEADVDAVVRRVDRLDGSRLSDEVLVSTLYEAGVLILRHTVEERACRSMPRVRAPRRLLLLGLLLVGAFGGVAAASGVFVNANTHTYNHGWQRLAGGPGENLRIAGTNFVQVVVRESAGISYPARYAAWRIYAIKQLGPTTCPSRSAPRCVAVMSTGMINAGIAQSAFAAWVLDWRDAKLTGNAAGAHQAAAVIARARHWRATTDLGAANNAEYFGWMKSFVRAVEVGSVSAVDRLISSVAGGYFPLYDPGFQAWWRAHPRVNPFPAYLAYIDRGRR